MNRYNLKTEYIKNHIFDGEFALEKESLRVTPTGYIAKTPHSFNDMDNITRDFSEAQLEFITTIHNSTEDAINELRALHTLAYERLAKQNELIWCFSNPPIIDDENSIDIAKFNGSKISKEIYREYLAEKYGKRKMLLSGIHFNFSFPEALISFLFENSNITDYISFKNNLYLDIADKLIEYSWLIVILTASSSVCDASYFEGEKRKTYFDNFSTIRCGANGYWNTFIPFLDYSNIESYTYSIREYINQGLLKSESELYCPVRLKPRGEYSLDTLLNKGINHLEFRLLDVNPLYNVGVNSLDLKFIHLLIVYLLTLNNPPSSRQQQKLAFEKIRKSSVYDIKDFIAEGKEIINSISKQFEDNLPNDYREALFFQLDKLNDENKLYSHIVHRNYSSDYVGEGLKIAEKYFNELRR